MNSVTEKRVLELDNGLIALLISEPKAAKSAAALSVGSGSLDDPLNSQGLAHFVEHMLFLGTEDYPGVDEYHAFVQNHGGYSNAYTAADETNYHFEISNDAFAEALDRFASFFRSPLFEAEYVDRELSAIESEHQKNIESDLWRSRMLLRLLYQENHPARKFSTGNRSTLQHVPRETLLSFYESHYAPANCRLTVISPKKLDDVEASVRKSFTGIKQRPFVPESNRSECPSFSEDALPRMMAFKSLRDTRKVTLLFPAPNHEPHWEGKPGNVICHLIGHEGEGSLLSALKKEGLATELGAWIESHWHGSLFHFEVSLTHKGLGRVQDVIGLFFRYVDCLTQKELPEYIFKEKQTIAQIELDYRDTVEGASGASHLASRLHYHPPMELESRDLLLHRFDAAIFQEFLSKITPETMQAILSAPDVETDTTEQYYRVEYKLESCTSADVASWKTNAPEAHLALPAPNRYIPVGLQSAKPAHSDTTTPQKMCQTEASEIWTMQDKKFGMPKCFYRVHCKNPWVNANPKTKLVASLYISSLMERLNEWLYEVSLGGTRISLSRTEEGIQIDAQGFGKTAFEALKDFVKELRNPQCDPKIFEDLKAETSQALANVTLDAPYQQALYELKAHIRLSHVHRDKLRAIPMDTVKQEDVLEFSRNFFSKGFVEVAAYGHLNDEEIAKQLEGVCSTIFDSPDPALRDTKAGFQNTFSGEAFSRNVEVVNNAFLKYRYIGEREPALVGALKIAHAFLQPLFFTDLRTQAQLGYVVHSAFYPTDTTLGILYLIQSEQATPQQVAEAIETWERKAYAAWNALDSETFKKLQSAAYQELMEPEPTMGDTFHTFTYELYCLSEQFDYKKTVAQALRELTQESAQALLQGNLDSTSNDMASYSIYGRTTPT